MAVNTVQAKRNLSSTADTDRSPSPNIWADCPVIEIQEGTLPGVYFFDDFLSFPKTPATTEGNWSHYAQFSSTGGSITAGTGQGGEAIFASDDDNEGASIRTLATPFKIARSLKKLWFECRIKTSTIADTKHGIFVGLMQNVALTATMPIAADGTLGDTNFVGFHRLEGDGDQIDTVYKADGVTQVSVQTDALVSSTTALLVADTYMKLGMVFDPNDLDGTWRLTFYANGIRLTSAKQIPTADGTDFPNDIGLGLVFAVLNATGSTPGNSTIDWWGAAQLL